MVSDMVTNMELDMVADMEVDKHVGFAKKKWFAIEEAKEKATDHGWHLCNLILSKYIMVFNVPL